MRLWIGKPMTIFGVAARRSTAASLMILQLNFVQAGSAAAAGVPHRHGVVH
jgi:hypothetical protein